MQGMMVPAIDRAWLLPWKQVIGEFVKRVFSFVIEHPSVCLPPKFYALLYGQSSDANPVSSPANKPITKLTPVNL